MTNYEDGKRKMYICFVQDPNGKVRLLNQVQVVYDEGTSTEVSGWEQRPLHQDPLVNPTGALETQYDGIRFFQDGVPGEDYMRIS